MINITTYQNQNQINVPKNSNLDTMPQIPLELNIFLYNKTINRAVSGFNK